MKRYNLFPQNRQIAGREIPTLTLGESGRAREEVIILFEAKDSPLVDIVTPKPGHPGRPRVVKSDSNEGWLARVNCQYTYKRDTRGLIYAPPGAEIRVVARGKGAYGAAGGVGSWFDYLLAVKEGSWVRVKRTGKTPYILLFADDKVHELSYEEALYVIDDLHGSTDSSPGDVLIPL